MKVMKRKSYCPIHFGLELFGDKWTLLIIRDIMFKGKHYFGAVSYTHLDVYKRQANNYRQTK